MINTERVPYRSSAHLHLVLSLPMPTEAVYITALLTTGISERFPFCLAKALEQRAAARARSASAMLAQPVRLTVAANASENLPTLPCSGVGTAKTIDIAARRYKTTIVRHIMVGQWVAM